jgi:hypothetical protein
MKNRFPLDTLSIAGSRSVSGRPFVLVLQVRALSPGQAVQGNGGAIRFLFNFHRTDRVTLSSIFFPRCVRGR